MTDGVVVFNGVVMTEDGVPIEDDGRALERRGPQMPALPESTPLVGGVFGRLNKASSAAFELGKEVTGSAGRLTRQFVTEAEHLVDVALPAGTPRIVVHAEVVEDEPATQQTPIEPPPPTAEELRRAGDRLLARSAESRQGVATHPAFQYILEQLAPDEARILRLLASGPQPAVDVRTNRPFGVGSEAVAFGLSMIPEVAGCRNPERITAYLGNLHRLGLIWFSKEPVELHRYELVQVQPAVAEAISKAGRYAKVIRRRIEVTAFGAEFFDCCFTT